MAPEVLESPTTPEQQEVVRLKTENTALREENERLRNIAYTDSLMGIANRNAYNEKREESPDAVLLLDIDNFKIVNDAFQEGHSGGDRILREAGEYLKSQFREGDFIARIGGEEIVVFLKNADVERFKEKVRLGFTTELDGEKIPITFSGGLTQLNPGESVKDAIERADTALYVAKEDKAREDGTIDRGRDRILIYSETMKKEAEGK
ncbi:MAG TPA: GGDEF domain-containing protein [Candidatus Paceibacterota bacterium]|nr:GGDEF domain-containing protein [Candidatus Paceibacterota bacterium]